MFQSKNAYREPRRKVFLAAFIEFDKATSKCRIKNLTQTGALIEATSDFSTGATVMITRGELGVAGEIMWSYERFFGVRFSDQIEVQKWLDEPFTTGPMNAHNQRPSLPTPVKLSTLGTGEFLFDDRVIDLRLSEEILYVSRIVEEVSQILVKDPLLRIRHSSSLQQLDNGQQMLSEIAQLLPMEDKLNYISHVATGPMRGRLLRTKPI